MEEGECEQHWTVRDWLRRLLKRRLVEERPRAAHIGLHVCRRLVGDFDCRLHDALGHEHLRGHTGRLSGDEATEIFVADLGCDFELALEHWQPALHQMHVLQEGPTALSAQVAHATKSEEND